MKKKIVMGVIVLALNMLCTACSNADVSAIETTIALPDINKEGIKKAIEQSAMPDRGYRFANKELESQFSVYATYYIRKAKESAGLSQVPISSETKNKIIERFLNSSDLDLTDVFCAVSLLEDSENLPIKTKENISSYFDTLYDETIKCYVLHDREMLATNLYASYSVDTTANLLDIEKKSIIDWLEKLIQDLFNPESIIAEKSSTYSVLFELAKSYNLEVPQEAITSVIQMFESSLNALQADLQALEKEGAYIPVFLMDYLEFSKLSNHDSSENWEKVIQVLCDENGIRENTFVKNDTYGLYATVRALELAQYDFESCTGFNDVFNEFDLFMLNADSYISPMIVESNLVNTYYADALIHKLDLKLNHDISEYCIENKNQILESDALNIYHYLELLQRNNLLKIVEADRQSIISKLSSILETLVADTESINVNLPAINGSIKGLNILEESWEISEESFQNIIKNFSKSDYIQQEVYDLAKLVEFIYFVSPDNEEMLQKYCQQLEKAFIQLSSAEASLKMMLQSTVFDVFEKANYTITQELKQIVKETLNQAQDNSGLFKGGDSDEDDITFRETYYAIMLYEKIN